MRRNVQIPFSGFRVFLWIAEKAVADAQNSVAKQDGYQDVSFPSVVVGSFGGDHTTCVRLSLLSHAIGLVLIPVPQRSLEIVISAAGGVNGGGVLRPAIIGRGAR